MATGRQPFSGNTSAVVFDAILNRTPASPTRLNSHIPPELAKIIETAIEKNRRARYQLAAKLREDLKRLKHDSGSGRIAAAKGAEKSLSLLYFEDFGYDNADQDFSYGINVHVIRVLSRISRLGE